MTCIEKTKKIERIKEIEKIKKIERLKKIEKLKRSEIAKHTQTIEKIAKMMTEDGEEDTNQDEPGAGGVEPHPSPQHCRARQECKQGVDHRGCKDHMTLSCTKLHYTAPYHPQAATKTN